MAIADASTSILKGSVNLGNKSMGSSNTAFLSASNVVCSMWVHLHMTPFFVRSWSSLANLEKPLINHQ